MKRKIFWGVFIVLFTGLAIYYFYPEPKLPEGTKIDEIIVYKSGRQLQVFSNNQFIKTYKISLGRNPSGKKEFEGDKKTPEGIYYIYDKNPNSGYHKNLGISYPNTSDRQNAVKQGKLPGGDIKIHGIRNRFGFIGKFHRWADWTLGCIAVTNQEIDELYNAVLIGAKIEIKP